MSDAPIRVQLSRAKDWRMPPNTARVARPGLWGNPFQVGVVDAVTCVAFFENAIHGGWNPATGAHLPDDLFNIAYEVHCAWVKRWRQRVGCLPIEAVAELRGKNLACWCKLDAPCHADVLLRLANATVPA